MTALQTPGTDIRIERGHPSAKKLELVDG
jgi:hypothetical protein